MSDPNDPREIADLLPFYAAGTLTERDLRRVDAALAQDTALRRELDLVVEERASAIEANEALGVPSHRAHARLLAGLGAPPAPARRYDVASWLATRLSALTPRHLAWSALALGAIVVAQAGIIGVTSSRKGTFEMASVAPSAVVNGATFIVAFAPDARAAAIAKLLQDLDATIVSGPLPGGLYQLRVGDHALDAAHTAATLARLKGNPALVSFAAAGQGAE